MSAHFSAQPLTQITVEELAKRLNDPDRENLQLIDVRELEEIQIAKIDGFQVFPLSQFAQWAQQIHQHLDSDKETLVLCHHGVRSAQMCQWLINHGFTQVKNIAGGIDAYATIVDPSIPLY